MIKLILGLLLAAGLVTVVAGCHAEGEINTQASPPPANVS